MYQFIIVNEQTLMNLYMIKMCEQHFSYQSCRRLLKPNCLMLALYQNKFI